MEFVCTILRGALVSCVLAVSTMVLTGCGGPPPGPERVPVSGKVVFDGKPLSGARVTFMPIEGTKGVGGIGATNNDGNYESVAYGRGGNGLVPGKYKVTVSKRVMPDGSPEPPGLEPIESPAVEKLPSAFSSQDESTLIRTVPEKGGTIDFDLKPG